MLENFDYTEILSSLRMSREYVSDIIDRTENNEIIAGYYRRLFEETERDRYFVRGYSVSGCGKTMLFDFHNKVKIADLIRTELCHDRFCPNCQKLKQATRLQQFMPSILETTEQKAVYHIVFTAPNVSASYLSPYISIFFEAFGRLIRILRGTDKIRGIDLSPLKFAAALRNLEITYGDKGYHVHIHSIVAITRDLQFPKVYRNKFSYDYSHGRRIFKRAFSDFEIFLQKIWRLLVDQIVARVYKFGPQLAKPIARSSPLYSVFGDKTVLRKGKGRKHNAVTLIAIQSMGLEDGYSVIMDPVTNDHFVQAFKYAFKVESEDHAFMTYEQFKTLEQALFGRKAIQGYGAWFNLHCEDEIDESFDEFFDVFKAYLWQIDRPESVNLSPDEVLARMKEGEYTFINRSKLRHILEDSAVSELLKHKDELEPAPKAAFSFSDLGRAYDRYISEKQKSTLFASVQQVEDPESGKRLLLLSEQQLNFLQDIF